MLFSPEMIRSGLLVFLLAGGALPAPAQSGSAWRALFDGRSLEGWRETPFKGRGQVTVEEGAIVLGPGAPLTGVNYTGAVPRLDYEVRFEAVRRKGNDFFAALTLPYGDSAFTFVNGGWGGDVVGISSIDGWDASENETRRYYEFENNRWYGFRIRVTEERIAAWIDEKQVVNVAVGGRAIGMRYGEIEKSAPFGFASYATAGAVRKVEIRDLK